MMLVVLPMTVAGILIFLEIKRHQALVLPAPTGPYAIGRVSYDWIDSSREEIFAKQKGSKRELLIWIWYPAMRVGGTQPTTYLPPNWGQAWNDLHGPFPFDLLLQSYDSIHVHAVANALISPEQKHYPVLIFEPGLGNLPTDSTTVIEDLVSHGYIVIGITPTYSSSVVIFPDGRTIESVGAAKAEGPAYNSSAAADKALNQLITIWAHDVIFVMNQLEALNVNLTGMFAKRLDLTRIGVFGHSFGGATAAEVCHLVARCKAGVDVDGTPYGDVVKVGLTKPFMFINHDEFPCSDPDCISSRRAISSIVSKIPHGEGYSITIKGTKHFNFTDYAIMFSPLQWFGFLGPINGQRGLQITRDYVRAFFDTYLKHAPSPLLQEPSSNYPEVQFETP